MTGNTLLSVEDVTVNLPTPRGNLRAVDHVDLIVGEEVVERGVGSTAMFLRECGRPGGIELGGGDEADLRVGSGRRVHTRPRCCRFRRFQFLAVSWFEATSSRAVR